jgi:PKD repeat protein
MKLQSITLAAIMLSFLFTVACEKEQEERPDQPTACFVPPDATTVGEPVMFLSSCSENALSYSWDFGDGNTSADANPMHTYTDGGEYTVTLTVDNGEGGTDEQTVVITVQVPSVIEHSGIISEDETWIEAVHLITGDVSVRGATLTIEPGAVIHFSSGTGLNIGSGSNASGATLRAEGTSDKPITFTSAAATQSPGDWDYIGFYEAASDQSVMQYCIVEYGGRSANSGELYLDGTKISVENSIFRYSGGYGISLTNDASFQSFINNEVYENQAAPVSIYGNFVHTIGEGNEISGDQGIRVAGDWVEMADVTWLEQTTAYFIEGDLNVGSETGTKLTLSPGVEIRMGSGTGIFVGNSGNFGTLVAEGTEENRILFTSAAAQGLRSPGDWDYLGFYDGAGSASTLAYCDFEFGGGYSASVGMIYIDGSSVSLTECNISNSESIGINLTNDGMFETFSGNSFAGNATYPIEIYGNYVHTISEGNSFEEGSGILVRGDNVEQADITWRNQGAPYIMDGDISLGTETGARLVIEPGTMLKFTENTSFSIGNSGKFGVLVADGEPDNQIVFTSGAPAGFESGGDWDGIWFYEGTGNSTLLDHCHISYAGGYGTSSGNLNVRNGSPGVPEISNSLIAHSAAWGVYINNSSEPTLTDVTFENNQSGDTNK